MYVSRVILYYTYVVHRSLDFFWVQYPKGPYYRDFAARPSVCSYKRATRVPFIFFLRYGTLKNYLLQSASRNWYQYNLNSLKSLKEVQSNFNAYCGLKLFVNTNFFLNQITILTSIQINLWSIINFIIRRNTYMCSGKVYFMEENRSPFERVAVNHWMTS